MCAPGYRKIGQYCNDIDECEEELNNCDKNSNCVNSVGSHECQCKPGYVKNERHKCIDENECIRGVCTGKDQSCKNTIGSYEARKYIITVVNTSNRGA